MRQSRTFFGLFLPFFYVFCDLFCGPFLWLFFVTFFLWPFVCDLFWDFFWDLFLRPFFGTLFWDFLLGPFLGTIFWTVLGTMRKFGFSKISFCIGSPCWTKALLSKRSWSGIWFQLCMTMTTTTIRDCVVAPQWSQMAKPTKNVVKVFREIDLFLQQFDKFSI